MNEVEKRIESLLTQIEVSADCICAWGKKGISTFDNLRRLAKDVKLAYAEEIDTGITYIEPKVKTDDSAKCIFGLMVGSSLLTAIFTAGSIFSLTEYFNKNELVKDGPKPIKVVEAGDDFIKVSKRRGN